jgi:hypothetical protein
MQGSSLYSATRNSIEAGILELQNKIRRVLLFLFRGKTFSYNPISTHSSLSLIGLPSMTSSFISL